MMVENSNSIAWDLGKIVESLPYHVYNQVLCLKLVLVTKMRSLFEVYFHNHFSGLANYDF